MKLTVHRNRTAVWGLARDGEEPWRWSRMKSPQTELVRGRSYGPLPPQLSLRPLFPSLGFGVPSAASPQRSRWRSWSTSASTGAEARTTVACSVSSVAPASHPPSHCHAIASSPTKWEMWSMTTNKHPVCTCHPPLEIVGTTRKRVLWMALHQHHPPLSPPQERRKRRREHWPVRCVVNTLTRSQIWIHTSELTVWLLSMRGTQEKRSEMANMKNMSWLRVLTSAFLLSSTG